MTPNRKKNKNKIENHRKNFANHLRFYELKKARLPVIQERREKDKNDQLKIATRA